MARIYSVRIVRVSDPQAAPPLLARPVLTGALRAAPRYSHLSWGECRGNWRVQAYRGKANEVWQQETEGEQVRVPLIAHEKTGTQGNFELDLKIDVMLQVKTRSAG